MVTPVARREAVVWIRDRHGLSERRACRLASACRSMVRYARPVSSEEEQLRARLLELVGERPRFGYRRLHVLLRRDGHLINLKRVYRIYTDLGLAVRRKRRKRVAAANRRPRITPERADEQWSMDFMSDTLTATGRSFRTLNVVDDATRECLAIEVDTSLSGERVGHVLDRVAAWRRYPARIVVDNGPEFTSKALDQWAYQRGVELVFIRPGKPIENCIVESFNGRFRDECPNLHWFTSLADARRKIESWRNDYNHVRPHGTLGDRPPAVYATEAGLRPTASTSAPILEMKRRLEDPAVC